MRKSRTVLNVNLLGTYGSGKGTQAELLARAFGLVHIVPGDLFKDEIRRRTKIGRQMESAVRAGKLVLDSVWEIINTRALNKVPATRGVVYDGTPRNVSQKKLFDVLVQKFGRKPINILIDVSEKEAFVRLLKRKICSGCGDKPIGKNLSALACHKCGGKIVVRYDDRPEIIKKRLGIFKKEVVPVIKGYARAQQLYKVNGEQSPTAVQRDIRSVLKKLGFVPK